MHAEQAIERFGPLVMSLIWRINGNHDETADLYQEVFVKFHETTSERGPLQQPKAWLCRTAINAALDFKRQRSSEVESANAFLDSFETALETALFRDHDHDIDRSITISAVGVPHTVYEGSSDSTAVGEAIFLGDITQLNLNSLNLDSLRTVSDSLIAAGAAKIVSPSPGVTEDKSWGDIKKAAGSTTDDAP